MSMTDRELLERAAKAAGIGPLMNEPYGLGGTRYFYREDDYPSGTTWNPLTDDGDALRLAVKLNINVFIYDDETSTATKGVVAKNWGSKEANTRRAIVRTAAAMAKED